VRLLVTRPAEDAAPLAALLRDRGHEPVLEPLMSVRFLPDALPDLDVVAALLFTSANGVRAFAAASPRRDLPAYAVGERTAATLAEAGFAAIETAEGDAAALARLVAASRRPESGTLLHIAGTEVAGDLTGALGAAGFTIRRAVIYEVAAAEVLSAPVRADLAAAKIDGVLLFSPRTARIFAALLAKAGLAESGRLLTAWCLSPAVVEALAESPIRNRYAAERPNQEALLALIGDAKMANAGQPQKEDVVSETPPPSTARTEPDAVDPTAVPAPAPTTDDKAQDRTLLLVGGAIVVLALIGGATSPFWAPSLPWAPKRHDLGPPPPPPPAPIPTPAPTPAPASTATAPGAIPMTAPAVAVPDEDLRRELDHLGDRLATLEARPAIDQSQVQGVASGEEKLTATIGALTDRVAKLEADLSRLDRNAAADKAMILALGALRQDLAGSGPYDAPTGTLAQLAGTDQTLQAPIAVLLNHAKTGLPSRALLGDRLAALAPTLTIGPVTDSGAPWWRRYIVNPLLRLVRISRVPENGDPRAMPAGPDRVLAEAEAALGQGDLAGAVQLIKSLSGAGATTAAPWLADATARLDAEDAASRLDAALAKRLGTGAAP
jgi:uroporphyrinogen-III synthase